MTGNFTTARLPKLTVRNLLPEAQYIFKAAAVNELGVGPQTHPTPVAKTLVRAAKPSLHFVWSPAESGQGKDGWTLSRMILSLTPPCTGPHLFCTSRVPRRTGSCTSPGTATRTPSRPTRMGPSGRSSPSTTPHKRLEKRE